MNGAKCDLCHRFFANRYNLKVHIRDKHDTPEGTLQCEICNKQMRNSSSLRVHMYHHHRKQAAHLVHPENNDALLDLDNNVLGMTENAKKPGWNGKMNGAKCDLCHRFFANRYNLKVHIRDKHDTPEGTLQCEICNKQMRNSSSLRVHMYHHHRKQAAHLVHPENNDALLDLDNNVLGMTENAKKPGWNGKMNGAKCDLCHRFFANRYNLKVHIRDKHDTPEGTLQCEICNKQMRNSSCLRVHIYHHHRKQAAHLVHPENYAPDVGDKSWHAEGPYGPMDYNFNPDALSEKSLSVGSRDGRGSPRPGCFDDELREKLILEPSTVEPLSKPGVHCGMVSYREPSVSDIEDIQNAKENNEINLDIDADITDCVDHLIDNVLVNYVYVLGKQQHEINKKRSTKSDKNTPKSTKDTLDEHYTDDAKRVTLKLKHQKQAPNMNTTRQKKSKRITLPKKVEDTELQGSTNTKSPTNVVNNEKITLVDKNSENDLYLYNMSSESEDEAFKKKKIPVQKRVSSSTLESTSKRRRSVKPVNYTPYLYSSEDECHRVPEPKAVQQTKRSNRTKKIRRILADERMRTQQPEAVETSFLQEKYDTHIPDVPETALLMPVLEEIQPDDLIDEPIISEIKSRRQKKNEIIQIKTEKSLKKKCEKLTKPTITSKSKEIVTNVAVERESETVSSLPELVVETEPPKDDSLDANLFQKLKNISFSTMQENLNILVNNTIDGNMLNEIGDRQNFTRNQSKYNDNVSPATGNVYNFSDVLSEKSIATCGDSLITGHNNSDESPPNLDAMYESFQHRDVNIEGKSSHIAGFLVNMRNQTIGRGRGESSEDMESLLNPANAKSKSSASRVLINLCSENGKIGTQKVIEEPRIAKNISTRRRSVAKSCTIFKQFKPDLSPVRSNFDVPEQTRISRVNSQETAIKSSKQAADENPLEPWISVASVKRWIRNAAAETSKTGDNTDIIENIYREVLETLETRLLEINATSGEALQAYLLETHEQLSRLSKESDDRQKAKVVDIMKSHMERACALVRADAEKKTLMVVLLKDDLKRNFNLY